MITYEFHFLRYWSVLLLDWKQLRDESEDDSHSNHLLYFTPKHESGCETSFAVHSLLYLEAHHMEMSERRNWWPATAKSFSSRTRSHFRPWRWEEAVYCNCEFHDFQGRPVLLLFKLSSVVHSVQHWVIHVYCNFSSAVIAILERLDTLHVKSNGMYIHGKIWLRQTGQATMK